MFNNMEVVMDTAIKYSQRSGKVILKSRGREVAISVEELTGRVGRDNAMAVILHPNQWLPCGHPEIQAAVNLLT